MNLKIIPLLVGYETWPRSYMNGPGHSNEPEQIPQIMFYIEGADKKILVDTGGGEPNSPAQKKYHSGTFTRKPEEEPRYQLQTKCGVTPEEIEMVILTHLHWDHIGGINDYPNAEFVVQISEMYDSINPIARFAKTYESFSIGAVPPWAQQPRKWRFIDGDVEIAPGIWGYLTPGHSKGIMGIGIETKKGMILIAGDSLPLYDNIGSDLKVVPSMLSWNLEAAFKSCDKVNAMKLHDIIPGHDAKVFNHSAYPHD